jgi:hypothetical protein
MQLQNYQNTTIFNYCLRFYVKSLEYFLNFMQYVASNEDILMVSILLCVYNTVICRRVAKWQLCERLDCATVSSGHVTSALPQVTSRTPAPSLLLRNAR